jgi:transcriptional regulator with XRE-family HTH domain
LPNVDKAAKAWEMELSRRVGDAIQARRKALKLTAVDLAERTKALGYPVNRVAISKIEGNLRAGKLDAAELLTIAAALDVPPLVLLFPDLPDGCLEIIPEQVGTSWEAYEWATGRKPGFAADSVGATSEGYRLIQAVLERNQLSMELVDVLVELGPKAHSHEQDELDSMERRRSSIRTRVAELNAEIRELGGVIDA